jgi:hypothetical protein
MEFYKTIFVGSVYKYSIDLFYPKTWVNYIVGEKNM